MSMWYVGTVSIWYLLFAVLCGSKAFAQIRFTETGGGTDYISLQAPASVPSNFIWTLPNGDGSPNQCLATNGSGTLFWKTAGGSANSLDASDGSPANALYVDAAGNVGIGTTAPWGPLHVQHASAPYITITRPVDTNGFILGADGNSAYIFQKENRPLSFGTNNAERLRIDQNGNVGIGATAPEGKLDVRGTIMAGAATTGIANPNAVVLARSPTNAHVILERVGSNTGGMAVDVTNLVVATELGGLIFKTGIDYNGDYASTGTERMRIAGSGNVGIGTTSPQAGLDVSTTGSSASAIIVPRDTTANRPGTAVNGMIRYNTSTGKFEGYEGGGWVPLSSGLVGTLKYAGASGCVWTTSGTSWGGYAADTGCATPTATGGATGPGTKIPAVIFNSLPAGDYELTVSGQFTLNASANWCRWRISDGTSTSGVIAMNLDAEGTSQITGLFSYASSGNRTFTIQALGGSSSICWLSADEPGNTDLTFWLKRI